MRGQHGPTRREPVILYEYPFNERIRTYLRLEQLFKRLAALVPRDHPLDHHYAIQTLFEIMDVASRADMKSDVLKDLDRQKQALAGFRGNPAISESALETAIAPYRNDKGLVWRPSEASLEDVFIDLMSKARDNFQ